MVRGRWGIWGIVLPLLCLAPSRGHSLTRVFEVTTPISVDESSIRVEDGFSHSPFFDHGVNGSPGEPSIAWLPLSLPSAGSDDDVLLSLEIVEADTLSLVLPLAPTQRDLISSDTSTSAAAASPDPLIYESHQWFPIENVRMVGSGMLDRRGIVSAVWSPFRYLPTTQQLIVIRRAVLTLTESGFCAPGDVAPETTSIGDALLEGVSMSFEIPSSATLSPAVGDQPLQDLRPSWALNEGLPLGVEYVVVTPSAFAHAVKPLVLWKARRGISAGIATTEDIVSQYPAVDPPASMREYLKAAYSSGLRWVVIGGDETVAPVRRAYAEFPVYDGDPYKLQQCDLYFAELDGNWDADGDGVWGEFFGDQAQIFPELYVGRLPFSTVEEAGTIIDKIIAYERGPLQADYLTRSLSVSTDQFRDWSSGIGQHGVVAQSMPSAWAHDLSTMIEAPTGSDPAPVYPEGTSFGAALAGGAGWVNYFVHGRADGFVVRSAGIMEWPRAYVFTNGAGDDGNGYLNLAPASSTPGIHLSAACDQGGFDLDAPPYSYSVDESVAEKLLFMPGGGAAAFVGQSRWGWVSTSYKLIQKFYEYVANPATPNHVGVYQTLAKLAYGSFRDLVYGNNLYGDPEMPVWMGAPKDLSVFAPVTFSPGGNEWTLRAAGSSGGVNGALVTLSIGDSVWVVGQTGADGTLSASVTLPYAATAILTVSKGGHRAWVDTLPVSIISDVFDDGDALPSSYLTVANYPNPFNAGTVLTISLPVEGSVTIAVFDVLGRRVRTLVGGAMSGGEHRVVFDGRAEDGRLLASGIYFARVRVGAQVVMRKLVLVR